jgi:hypothetical protein
LDSDVLFVGGASYASDEKRRHGTSCAGPARRDTAPVTGEGGNRRIQFTRVRRRTQHAEISKTSSR